MATTWIYNFTTGNDTTGNGTLATPYKTAFKAGSVMQPGDSIANSDGQSTEADDVTITDAAALTSINCSLPNNSFNINQSDPSISTTATGLILSGNDSNTNLLLADCQGSLTIAGATLTSNYPGSGATDASFQFLPAGYLRLTGIRGTAPSCMRFNGTVYGAYIDDFVFTGTTQAMDGNVGGLDTPVDVVVGDLVGGTVTATGTATNALWTNDGDYINTFSMNKVRFHCINTDPNPANLGDCFIFDSNSTCTVTLSNCPMLADTVANGIRLGVNVGVGVNKTLRLSNVSMDLHTGTLTTGSAFVVNRDTVTATGGVRVNCNKTVTLTNSGTFDMTGLTMTCLGSDSIHGGPVSAYLIWDSSGSLNSSVANLDLTGTRTVYVRRNLTITQNGGHTVTDSASTVYLQSPGATVSFSGWTPSGTVRNTPPSITTTDPAALIALGMI